MMEQSTGFIASNGDAQVIVEVRGPELLGYIVSLRATGKVRLERALGYDLKKVNEFIKRAKTYYVKQGYTIVECAEL